MEHAGSMTADTQQQFVELLERHRGIVFKVAGMYCRNPEDRADIAQEIAAQLWRAFPNYDAARPFATWMYRVALNVAISHLRSNSWRERQTVPFDETLHDTADDNGADHETDEHARMLQQCIARLDPFDRALLLLHFEERSHREIADVLGISETNVSTRIGRLKQRIRNDIKAGDA